MTTPLAPKLMNLGTTWRYSSNELHAAYDYPVSSGTPVRAVRDGVVLATHDGEPNNIPPDSGFTGKPANFVLLGIQYKGRPASVLYLHLSPGLNVKQGDHVKAGHRLGNSGNSGHTTGPHLHVAAMFGHRDESTRFAYLGNIPDNEPPPHGVASNGICIFPPKQVYGRTSSRPRPFASGTVNFDELRFGVEDSDSVRRLQHRLNHISLDLGVELPVTGNYLDMTRDEVQKWQIQKDDARPGSDDADGILSIRQARRLFTKAYKVRQHA